MTTSERQKINEVKKQDMKEKIAMKIKYKCICMCISRSVNDVCENLEQRI